MAALQPNIPTAVTIGNFDGVHLGHAALVAAARRAVGDGGPAFGARLPAAGSGQQQTPEAESREPSPAPVVRGRGAECPSGRVVVLCFDPNPLTVLRPQEAPPQLTSFAQRREELMRLGADVVAPLRPSRQFLAQSPAQFVEWLVRTYQPAVIVEGPDFRFGRGRAGSVQTLRRLGNRCRTGRTPPSNAEERDLRDRINPALPGFETIVVDPVEVPLTDMTLVRASSSIVRWLLGRGRVRDARHVLGRPYTLRGNVMRGDQRGRAIGVPTANLDSRGLFLPADGVYAGFATVFPPAAGSASSPAPDRLRGRGYAAAISVGTNPTFGRRPRCCEAHFLDYDGPDRLYGWTIQLEFHEWIRDQLTFNEIEPLIDQIRRDVAMTRKALGTRHEALGTS